MPAEDRALGSPTDRWQDKAVDQRKTKGWDEEVMTISV